jgi:predicted membrane channel-forming protein YqfA (hemolysin III family)
VKRVDINYIISLLLLFSMVITGITGYIQSQLDLRKFVPHRYFAYVTLGLVGIHVCLNAGKIWRYIRRKFKREE